MATSVRVLLVEDSADDAVLIERALAREGFEVSAQRVDDESGLVAALAMGPWDVVVSDHALPGFSSQAALRLVRAHDADLPFLIVSGTMTEEDAVEAMREGAQDFLTKQRLTRLGAAVDRELREAGERRARRAAEREKQHAEDRYRNLVESIPAITFIVRSGSEWTTLFVSPQIEKLTGFAAREWIDTPGMWLRQTHPSDRTRLREELRRAAGEDGMFHAEFRMLSKDGRIVWLRAEGEVAQDGFSDAPVLRGFAVDVTEQRRAEQMAHQLAYYDRLTDLPNRRLLEERLEERVREARHRNHPLALMLVNIRRFREFNHTLGHATGDLLLQHVGRRLAGIEGQADTVARFDGDTFALLIPNVNDDGAQRIAHRIIETFEAPISVENLSLEVEPAIGIALFPLHGEVGDILIQRAHVACDTARVEARGSMIYSSDRDPHTPRRLALIAQLRRAIESDELRLHYQPKVDLATGVTTGVEALVRWQHPQLGTVPPAEFIGVAEQGGLIRPLTRWVVNRAAAQCREWLDAGIDLKVAVNISAKNLEDVGFEEYVVSTLAFHNVPTSSMQLELTESSLMESHHDAAEILKRLRAHGLQLSIDDFGTGYSSMMHLRALPFNELKIDRSFVFGLENSEEAQEIVRFITELGHHLRMSVVAEGVEEAAGFEVLKRVGCDLAQGYYMSKPLPPEDLVTWLQTSAWGMADPDAESVAA